MTLWSNCALFSVQDDAHRVKLPLARFMYLRSINIWEAKRFIQDDLVVHDHLNKQDMVRRNLIRNEDTTTSIDQ